MKEYRGCGTLLRFLLRKRLGPGPGKTYPRLESGGEDLGADSRTSSPGAASTEEVRPGDGGVEVNRWNGRF